MIDPRDPERHLDRVILLFLFALSLFSPPLIVWWAGDVGRWFIPYLVWLLAILLGAWVQCRYGNHDL